MCIFPVVLTYRLVSLIYAQLIAHTMARLHPLTLFVCDWLQAASHPRYWSREFRKEVKPSHVLFLQECVHPKETKGREGVNTRHSRPPVLPHLQLQMAHTQQFFTGKLYVPVHMLKLPAEELLWSALPRMTQEEEADGSAVGRGLKKVVFHTRRSRIGF